MAVPKRSISSMLNENDSGAGPPVHKMPNTSRPSTPSKSLSAIVTSLHCGPATKVGRSFPLEHIIERALMQFEGRIALDDLRGLLEGTGLEDSSANGDNTTVH